jgi:hypothetical protein
VEILNMGLDQLRISIQGLFQGASTKTDTLPLALGCVGLFLLSAPLDVLQLACMLIGAVVYAVMTLPVLPRDGRSKVSFTKTGAHAHSSPVSPASSPSKHTAPPVKSPVFSAYEFDMQVDELITRISPTTSCHQAVEDLVSVIRDRMQTLIPEAEVMGFTTANLGGSTAYAVAVPEVEIVANARPEELIRRLSQMSSQRAIATSRLDIRKLQKSAIRVCTSLLVSVGLKFRRSSFRSEEPKVTLLAPASLLGTAEVSIPIDFSINNATPLYNMALLTECGQMDPRAKSLVLLVKRWAKDRGVCHASQGHLPPYAWSLLAIYFLQVGVEEADGGLPLPALDSFAVSSSLMKAKDGNKAVRRRSKNPQKKTVGDLFTDFIRFYNRKCDWRKEAVSVRLGKRAPPDLSLDIHVLLNDDGTTAVAPTIEDPFDVKKNLGRCTNPSSLQRFFEELDRADVLLTRGASLTQLLEPWRPPGHITEPNDSVDPGDDHQAYS